MLSGVVFIILFVLFVQSYPKEAFSLILTIIIGLLLVLIYAFILDSIEYNQRKKKEKSRKITKEDLFDKQALKEIEEFKTKYFKYLNGNKDE